MPLSTGLLIGLALALIGAVLFFLRARRLGLFLFILGILVAAATALIIVIAALNMP